MSRIIAGEAGGLRLTSVPGTGTRPTTDRVKESLFSRLEAWGMLADARVLDLYAGSGALGCEAASRGAVSVDLVERDAKALNVARANAQMINQALGAEAVAVHRGSVATYLAVHTGPWDLVMADPPYPVPEHEITQFLHPLVGRLGPGAVVVVERSSRSPQPTWPEGLQALDCSKHGETTLWFAEQRDAALQAQ